MSWCGCVMRRDGGWEIRRVVSRLCVQFWSIVGRVDTRSGSGERERRVEPLHVPSRHFGLSFVSFFAGIGAGLGGERGEKRGTRAKVGRPTHRRIHRYENECLHCKCWRRNSLQLRNSLMGLFCDGECMGGGEMTVLSVVEGVGVWGLEQSHQNMAKEVIPPDV